MRLIRSRKGRIWLILAIAGPGVVAANAGNDAAGIATYASAGSQFVFRTLFFMVLVTFALVLVQEMAVRLGTHTGKGLAALIREQFSLRLTGVALFCVLLANTGLVVSEFAGIGAAFQLCYAGDLPPVDQTIHQEIDMEPVTEVDRVGRVE